MEREKYFLHKYKIINNWKYFFRFIEGNLVGQIGWNFSMIFTEFCMKCFLWVFFYRTKLKKNTSGYISNILNIPKTPAQHQIFQKSIISKFQKLNSSIASKIHNSKVSKFQNMSVTKTQNLKHVVPTSTTYWHTHFLKLSKIEILIFTKLTFV